MEDEEEEEMEEDGLLLVTGTELLGGGGRIHDLDIHKMIFCDYFRHIGTGSSTTELSDFVF